MEREIITITTENLPSCKIIQVFPVESILIEEVDSSNISTKAQMELEKKVLSKYKRVNGIIGFRMILSSSYSTCEGKGYGEIKRITKVIAFGTPVCIEKLDKKCIITYNFYEL